MEADRAHHRVVNAIHRPQRTARLRSKRCFKRHIVDLAYWCTMERLASAISTVPNVPSTLPAMGQTRCFQTHCRRAGRRPVRTRRNRHPCDDRKVKSDGDPIFEKWLVNEGSVNVHSQKNLTPILRIFNPNKF